MGGATKGIRGVVGAGAVAALLVIPPLTLGGITSLRDGAPLPQPSPSGTLKLPG